MKDSTEKQAFDNRKFILPSSRNLGPPPWSFSTRQVAQVSTNSTQQTNAYEESSSRPSRRGFIERLKSQILTHLLIISILLSPTAMKMVPNYKMSPALKYISQVVCHYEPTVYFHHVCDLIAFFEPSSTQAVVTLPANNILTLPRRNFASYWGGAVILREYTSSTYGIKPCRSWPFVVRACELQNMEINSPNVILEENTEEGNCWEFSGSSGQVAFNLSEPAFITDVALDYAHPSLLSRLSYEKMPQKVSVWVLVDEVNHQNTNVNLLASLPAISFLTGREQRNSRKPNGMFVRIAQFEYSVVSDSVPTKQYFGTVTSTPKLLSQTVVLRVESNLGAPTTCLYWVGVFGETSLILEH